MTESFAAGIVAFHTQGDTELNYDQLQSAARKLVDPFSEIEFKNGFDMAASGYGLVVERSGERRLVRYVKE